MFGFFYEEVFKFIDQNRLYPEKIIMSLQDMKDLKTDFDEKNWSYEILNDKLIKYEDILIEGDDKINNWIIIAPEFN